MGLPAHGVGNAVLMIGSRAAERHESGQVRKEAAISDLLRVLRGSLIGAGYLPHRCAPRLEGGVAVVEREHLLGGEQDALRCSKPLGRAVALTMTSSSFR